MIKRLQRTGVCGHHRASAQAMESMLEHLNLLADRLVLLLRRVVAALKSKALARDGEPRRQHRRDAPAAASRVPAGPPAAARPAMGAGKARRSAAHSTSAPCPGGHKAEEVQGVKQ